jgi:hypothetical protein
MDRSKGQKRQAWRATTFKYDWPPRLSRTDPKGHYAQKELLDNKYRPKRSIHPKRTGPKGHYVQKRLARRDIIDFKISNVQDFDYSSICNSRFWYTPIWPFSHFVLIFSPKFALSKSTEKVLLHYQYLTFLFWGRKFSTL